MTKEKLIMKVKRRLGHPMVKVELDDSQIIDHIDYARDKYIKWAVGNATQEVFFTLMLSGGQHLYDLPIGVTEVVTYEDYSTTGGINTLFTIENYLYNQGVFNPLVSSDAAYTLVSYHIARDFLESLDRYVVDAYNYKYHPYTNQLEIQPPPPCDSSLVLPPSYDCDGNETHSGGTYNSPGWILIDSYMIEGSTLDGWSPRNNDSYIFESDWILDYTTALSKITLGMIRNKFANFASIGNAGISLDGDTMISEGKEEKERLEETLRDEEAYEGYGITVG
jgi:hypothetical protein